MSESLLFSLLAGVFILFSLIHFFSGRNITRYAVERGILNGVVVVKLSGVLLLAAGTALLIESLREYALYALSGYSMLSALIMHKFWDTPTGEERLKEGIGFIKNVLIAVLLLYLAIGPEY